MLLGSKITTVAALAMFWSAGADAQKSRSTKKDDKKQKQVQQRAERKDRDCTKEMGAGATWSAAQNRCLPPRSATPKKEVVKGATGPKGGAAPVKVTPAAPRGAGQSCGMVGNTMLSCRAPFVCVDKVCKNPAGARAATKVGEGQKCGPTSGGGFVHCEAGLTCSSKTTTCTKAAAATKTPPKATPATATRKAGEGRLCGNVKNASGHVERVTCEAGLTCKPSTKVAGLGSCAKTGAVAAPAKPKEEAKPVAGVGLGERCGSWYKNPDYPNPTNCGGGLSCLNRGNREPIDMASVSATCMRRCSDPEGVNSCFRGWTEQQ
ncbi:MAG: hypothetical protein HYY84_05375 [Deltaproteobacteria bacterium]|nr:hypothetical protein [Deltaproteobacteria bacterium]